MRKWDKQKLRAFGRRLLIVVLLVTAGLLWRATGYFSGVNARPGAAAAAGSTAENGAKPEGTVQPLAAVVCGADGGRYGTAYDQDAVMAVFHRFSADVGEALGSADAPETMSEQELRDSLGCCGLTLRFYSPQPLELLSSWLGAKMNGAAAGAKADLLCLCAGERTVTLCFRTETGACFRSETNVSAQALRSRTAEYTPNGAYYAFENALLAGGDDCAVILDGAITTGVVQYSAALPAASETDALLGSLGMNSYAARSYSEADGTVVFVDDDTTMRLATSGSLFFHRAGSPDPGPDLGVTGAVNAAWALAEQIVGSACGDAVLLLAGVTADEGQKSYTVALDYAVDGIPVRMAAGHAAEITFRSGAVVQARMEFRHFSLTGEQETLLPSLQAHAVAAAEHTSAELVYMDSGETMNCIWVRSDG